MSAKQKALRTQDAAGWVDRPGAEIVVGALVRVVSGSYAGKICLVTELVGYNGTCTVVRLRSNGTGPYAPLSSDRLVKLECVGVCDG